MKKLLVLLLVFALSLGLFAGCRQETPPPAGGGQDEPQGGQDEPQGGQDEPREAETVRFFNSVGAYKTLLEEEVANWNETVGAEQGITISMDTNIDNYGDALQLLITAGNAPDILCVPQIQYIRSGWLMPLDDIESVQEVLAQHKDVLVEGVNIVDGKTYSVPQSWYPIKFAYNKDLFVKNGIVDENGEAKPPETIDEMVEYARIITENGGGKEYGYGYTHGWTITARRFILKSFTMSTGQGWFDNTNGEYNFEPFAPMFEAVAQMFADGSVFPGYETISIDAIRAQFAEGNIGMMCAPSYDVGVYNNQFPAQCDWGVCDPPQLTADPAYKGVCFVADGEAISSSVAEDRLWAVGTVWSFLNSVEFKAKLFATGNIVPSTQAAVDYAYDAGLEFIDLKNWDVMGDVSNYTGCPPFPDGLLVLEGDDYELTFQKVLAGDMTVDEMVADLNERYNKAYQQGVQDGSIDDSIYHAPADLSR